MNCTRKRIECIYSTPKTFATLEKSDLYSVNPISSIDLQSTPVIFSLIEMRLFHHFLAHAYPHLPVGYDSAWVLQVPLIAHHVTSYYSKTIELIWVAIIPHASRSWLGCFPPPTHDWPKPSRRGPLSSPHSRHSWI